MCYSLENDWRGLLEGHPENRKSFLAIGTAKKEVKVGRGVEERRDSVL